MNSHTRDNTRLVAHSQNRGSDLEHDVVSIYGGVRASFRRGAQNMIEQTWLRVKGLPGTGT